MSTNRFTYEYVKNYVEMEIGLKYTLLSTEYKNANTKLIIICNNNHTFDMSFYNLKNLNCRCPYCKGLRLNLDIIKQFVEVDSGSNYKLLSTKYINAKSKLEFMCDKGHTYSASWTCFNQGSRCTVCEEEDKKHRLAHSFDYVKHFIEIESNSNWKLLSDTYINNEVPLTMMCDKGHILEKSFGNFIMGKRCWQCHIEYNRGENHSSWKPELTAEDRESGRLIDGYDDWIYSVYQRDNYTCQCCGCRPSNSLNSHHMDGYNWCKERRLDVSNGVTLCGDCHTNFHKEYGYGDNTEEQFICWILENGKHLLSFDEIKKESILKNKPPKRTVLEKQDYFRKYYEEHNRKYSENDIDRVFNQLINSIDFKPFHLTTRGFKEITDISVMSVTALFNLRWIDVLDKYNIREVLYQYVLEEYMKNYLSNYNCGIDYFKLNHKYISQDIIKQFTLAQIKKDCGFKKTTHLQNFTGLQKNFREIMSLLNKIPNYKEFIENTKISLRSYITYFGINDYEHIIKALQV